MEPDWHGDERVVREHFDVVSTRYARYWEEEGPLKHLFTTRRKRVLALLEDVPRGPLLDVGCGPALLAPSLVAAGFSYSGLDLSPGMVERARKQFGDGGAAEFSVGRVQDLPYADNSFVAVLALGILEYVADRDRAMAETARALRPGGALVFALQNRLSPYRFLERAMRTWVEPCPQFTEGYARRLVARHGLRPLDCVYYDFNVLPRPLDGRHPRLATALSGRLERLHRSPLRWLGTGFLVKAGKPG